MSRASQVTGLGVGIFGALGCVCLRPSVVRVLLRLRILGLDQFFGFHLFCSTF